jgi:outer membrane lipoprotein
MRLLSIAISLTLLTGCATIPEALRGDFTEVAPEAALGSNAAVRWGGRIIDVWPTSGETCLEVLAKPLDPRARPRATDTEIGRFRACKADFLDPALFATGREVTVTGRIVGEETRTLGEYEYRMPKLAVDELLLWPERPAVQRVHVYDDPFFWGPFPPYPPRIIVVPGPPPKSGDKGQ